MSTLADQFKTLTDHLSKTFLDAPEVDAQKWQSTKAPQPMVELFNRSFTLDLRGEQDPAVIAEAVKPNLPWADRHFVEERISGEPINPGETWKIWPYARSAARHLHEDGDPDEVAIYDHSYAERYWPKYAGMTAGGYLPSDGDGKLLDKPLLNGIRFAPGDLADLVQVLVDDPLTRQAYLPIFFPEDIMAAREGKRVPCTLGYHFIRRPMGNFGDFLHIIYPMRSCDYVRHFRDDVYLTIRLLLWVLEQCQLIDGEKWGEVYPGTFRMHITSLHMFRQDRENLRNAQR